MMNHTPERIPAKTLTPRPVPTVNPSESEGISTISNVFQLTTLTTYITDMPKKQGNFHEPVEDHNSKSIIDHMSSEGKRTTDSSQDTVIS